MPTALITNRIYLDNVDKELERELKEELTYKFYKNTGSRTFRKIETVRNYKLLPNNIISIPQARTDLIPQHYKIRDNRVLQPIEFPEPKFQLYEGQQEVHDQVKDNCMINAKPGWGKTFTSLHVLRSLGQKAIIIAPTINLREQWEEEVFKLFGVEAGIIGHNKVYDKKAIITISNIQTFRDRVNLFPKNWGTMLIDECHHTPATTFAGSADKLHCRYKIGLSATLSREDKRDVLFQDYFGSNVIVAEDNNALTPSVLVVELPIEFNSIDSWHVKLDELFNDPKYQNLVVQLTKYFVKLGHKVLLLSDRVQFLEFLEDELGEACSLITGTSGNRKLAKDSILNGTKDIIVASRAIFSEGISVNPLSCVINTTPTKNQTMIEQISGRVTRKAPGKLDPIIVDLKLAGPLGTKYYNARMGFYASQGWKVKLLKF